MKKRAIDLLVLSDIHLGTYGCRAKELNDYLRTIKPKQVVLNGDIIDIWQFKKSFFPTEHMRVVKRLLKWSARIPVHYITGNHDEALRRYSPSRLGQLQLVDQLVLEVGGTKHWFVHGDLFDASMKSARWLAKLGGVGYDLLIRINHLVNKVLLFFGRPRTSFSKKVKDSVKGAVKFIHDYEATMADMALHEGYSTVVCGHIHQPRMGTITTAKGTVGYLNSGDWIENMSALEFADGTWRLYMHERDAVTVVPHVAMGRERLSVA